MNIRKNMKKLQDKKFKVVKVDKDQFELDTGDVYPIPFELEEVLTIEEFQKLLDKSKDLVLSLMEKVDE